MVWYGVDVGVNTRVISLALIPMSIGRGQGEAEGSEEGTDPFFFAILYVYAR